MPVIDLHPKIGDTLILKRDGSKWAVMDYYNGSYYLKPEDGDGRKFTASSHYLYRDKGIVGFPCVELLSE